MHWKNVTLLFQYLLNEIFDQKGFFFFTDVKTTELYMFLCGVMETYRKNLRLCEFLLKFDEILVKFILNMARLVEIGEKLFGNPSKFGEVKKKIVMISLGF